MAPHRNPSVLFRSLVVTPLVRRGAAAAMATTIVVVGLSGIAAAYWSSSGQGTANAATGTITVSAAVTGTSGLYPGGSVPVTVAVKNTSALANVRIVSLVQSGATAIQTAGKAACVASVVSFTVSSLPSGSLSPGQSGNATGTVWMTTAAADGCQGATFDLPLTAIGQAS